jgi:hypothetical protein
VKKTLNAGALFLAVAMLAGLLRRCRRLRGRPGRLEPQGGGRLSRPAAGLVAEMAAGPPAIGARSACRATPLRPTRWRGRRCAARSAKPARAPPSGRCRRTSTKRVTMWKDVEPFYPDQTRGLPKTSESRGTEAILNALILSGR